LSQFGEITLVAVGTADNGDGNYLNCNTASCELRTGVEWTTIPDAAVLDLQEADVCGFSSRMMTIHIASVSNNSDRSSREETASLVTCA